MKLKKIGTIIDTVFDDFEILLEDSDLDALAEKVRERIEKSKDFGRCISCGAFLIDATGPCVNPCCTGRFAKKEGPIAPDRPTCKRCGPSAFGFFTVAQGGPLCEKCSATPPEHRPCPWCSCVTTQSIKADTDGCHFFVECECGARGPTARGPMSAQSLWDAR